MNDSQYLQSWKNEAHQRGITDAYNAASWIDISTEQAELLLKMIQNGDPAVDDYLPRRPNLSGEFADDPTPLSLAREITGYLSVTDDAVDMIASAYEDGVSYAFEEACTAALNRTLWIIHCDRCGCASSTVRRDHDNIARCDVCYQNEYNK